MDSGKVRPGYHSFVVSGSTFNVEEKYELIKGIGVGAYGVVCSATDKIQDTKVAIKKIPNAFEDLIDAKRILREIKLLSFFDHENIISLVDVPKPEARTGYNDIYIVTDLMETDLHRTIYSKQDISDEHIQYFVYQILRGLFYMHSVNVVHRDLKPSNILANRNCDLKICDLGLGRGGMENNDEMDTNTNEKNACGMPTEQPLTEYVITRWYRAPEVILCPSEYTMAVDIWSVGCIMAELLGRTPIFPGENYLDQIQKIIGILGTPSKEDLAFITNEQAKEFVKKLPLKQRVNFSSLYPKANPVALDLLSKMLTFNPNKRFTVEQCITHKYFEDLYNKNEVPSGTTKFDWSFDDMELTKENIQKCIYEEALNYHPNA